MGVHGLWRLLDTFGEVTRPEDWRGKKVAIDASIWIAQFSMQRNRAENENTEQIVLEGFLNRILKLLFYEIDAVFVFDGAAGYSKDAEHRRRAVARQALQEAHIRRQAKWIVAAQVASGTLSLKELPVKQDEVTPTRKEEEVKPENSDESVKREVKLESSDESDEKDESQPHPPTSPPPPQDRKYRSSRLSKKKKKRLIAPNLVSSNSTHSFLLEAQELLQEKYKGDEKVNLNVLKNVSTSLFMGPRSAVDEEFSSKKKEEEEEEEEQKRFKTDIVEVDPEVVSVSSSEDDSSLIELDSPVHSVIDDSTSNGSVEEWKVEHEVYSDSPDVLEALKSDSEWSLPEDWKSLEASEEPSVSQNLWNMGTQFLPAKEMSTSSLESDFSVVEMVNKGKRVATGAQPTTTTTSRTPAKGTKAAPVTSTFSSKSIPFELLEIVELLRCCGIPYIVSPAEADAQCAFLNAAGLVDAVFTEDSDVVVHGAPVVLRGFFSNSRSVVRYTLTDFETCGLTKMVFVSLANLLGCDYTLGVPGLGLIGSLEAVSVAWNPREEPPVEVAGEDYTTEVVSVLHRWKQLALHPPTDFLTADDDMSFLQWSLLSQRTKKWTELPIKDSFPDRGVAEAFYFPKVDPDRTSFSRSSPDFEAMRRFANSRGLLGAQWMKQRFESVQKLYRLKEEQHTVSNQRNLMEFGMDTQRREKWVFKKQSPKYAVALQRLRKCQKRRE